MLSFPKVAQSFRISCIPFVEALVSALDLCLWCSKRTHKCFLTRVIVFLWSPTDGILAQINHANKLLVEDRSESFSGKCYQPEATNALKSSHCLVSQSVAVKAEQRYSQGRFSSHEWAVWSTLMLASSYFHLLRLASVHHWSHDFSFTVCESIPLKKSLRYSLTRQRPPMARSPFLHHRGSVVLSLFDGTVCPCSPAVKQSVAFFFPETLDLAMVKHWLQLHFGFPCNT